MGLFKLDGEEAPVLDEGSPRRAMRTWFPMAIVAGALVLGPQAMAVGVSSASAAPKLAPPITNCDTYEAGLGPNQFSVDFKYSSQIQHWTVPNNVVAGSVCIDASGAQGGDGTGSAGGLGGAVNELFSVTAGPDLRDPDRDQGDQDTGRWWDWRWRNLRVRGIWPLVVGVGWRWRWRHGSCSGR